MPPSPVRLAVLTALASLAAALLPLMTAAPALASPTCASEKPFLGVTCDDETPPQITSSAVSIDGTTATAVAATDHGSQQGDDGDPIGTQCSLDGQPWAACAPFTGLAGGTHGVQVRAVDLADDAIVVPCDGLGCSGPEVPDHSAPVNLTFTIGGGGTGIPAPGPDGAPETQISGGPVDRLTPGSPVTLTRRPQVHLASSEPATFNCAVNARKVPCQAGVTVLKGLKPGNQVFVAQAVDRDGNFDATPATLTFYVPVNLQPAQGQGWKRVKDRGAYSGDYVSATAKGALLTLSLGKVRELRLIAPTGPELGKVAIRVGNSSWAKVSLKSAKAQNLQEFVIRGAGSGPVGGKVQIKAVKGSVAIDALVAR